MSSNPSFLFHNQRNLGPGRWCGSHKVTQPVTDRVDTPNQGSIVISWRVHCLFHTGPLPLSINCNSTLTLIFLPVLNCQTWSLWLFSKSSFSTFHPESPLNCFVLLSFKITCLCLSQHVSLTFWTLHKSPSDKNALNPSCFLRTKPGATGNRRKIQMSFSPLRNNKKIHLRK